MRRKLIKQDAFDTIVKESATTAERELVQAESYLAKATGKESLSLYSFTESTVVYKTLDDSFVHAGYKINNEGVTFNNIEELVIDESSANSKKRAFLSEMVDQVLEDNHAKAKELFKNYLGMVKRDKNHNVSENHKPLKKEDKRAAVLRYAESAGKDLYNAYKVAQNVIDYIDYMKVGPALQESAVHADDKGNVTDVRIPSIQQRNESRMQKLEWKTLNPKIASARRNIADLKENQDFCKAIANLKRQNAFSDEQALEEALDDIVKGWPQLLYATQDEVSQLVNETLQFAGIKNWDDETCSFMAEGILRKAHGAYSERVNQIVHLAGSPKLESNADSYEQFQLIVENFYKQLDEKYGLERKAFADLYEALEVLWKKADKQGNEDLKMETRSHLNSLAAVLNGEVKPELEIAEEAANHLTQVIEANVAGAGAWVVSNKVYQTVSGEHPQMAQNAKVDASASKYNGDWNDAAPMVDDNDSLNGAKGAKKHWGGEEGKDIFPNLNNPYIPKPFGDYTMKGEKGVDKDQGFDHSSSDTWPNLKNPYLPKEAGGEGGKGYKMNNGKDTDLVVEK